MTKPHRESPREDWPRSNHHLHGNLEKGDGCGLPIHLCECEDFKEDREKLLEMLNEKDEELDEIDKMEFEMNVGDPLMGEGEESGLI